MTVELKVPSAGESVADVEIGEWLKSEGDSVKRDETVVLLETDKASMEVPAPADGTLTSIRKHAGDAVEIGEVIAEIDDEGGGAASAEEGKEEKEEEEEDAESADADATKAKKKAGGKAAKKKAGKKKKKGRKAERDEGEDEEQEPEAKEERSGEAREEGEPEEEEREAEERREAEAKEEREGEAAEKDKKDEEEEEEREAEAEEPAPNEVAVTGGEERDGEAEPPTASEDEEVVRMSLLRRSIAKRLVEAQQRSALLTTFQEIDVSALQAVRRRFGEAFAERHGVKLGLMSLFVKAAIEGLKEVPELNAEVRGEDVVYHRRHHVGIAVDTERGLVVPVLRDADRMSLAGIEAAIDDFAARAARGQLAADELSGGTFTITNGGVFGSLLSTPLVSPPQSGVLGMHAIQDRPVARDGVVVVRPMMYVALTYDHRLVDGRQAVGFLRRVREVVEAPERLLLEA